MLRTFFDAALALDPETPDEARTMRYIDPDELRELWLRVSSSGRRTTRSSSRPARTSTTLGAVHGRVGPAGAYTVSLDPDRRRGVASGVPTSTGRSRRRRSRSARRRGAAVKGCGAELAQRDDALALCAGADQRDLDTERAARRTPRTRAPPPAGRPSAAPPSRAASRTPAGSDGSRSGAPETRRSRCRRAAR